MPQDTDLLHNEDKVRLKRCIYAAQKSTLPPITTHNLENGEDEVLNALRRCKLFNNKYDKVKVSPSPVIGSNKQPIIEHYLHTSWYPVAGLYAT